MTRAIVVDPGSRVPLSRRLLTPVCFLVLTALLLQCRAEPSSRVVTDDLGRRVALPAHVRRVVSLAPNITELLAALGATGSLVAVDDASNYPPEVRSIPRAGGVQPNIETIVSLRPDVVLASSSVNQQGLASSLQSAGIPLFVVRTDRLADIPRVMTMIGTIVGIDGAATRAAEFAKRAESEKRRREYSPRVLFLVWPEPPYVAGRNTFMDDLLILTGARNAVPEGLNGWPQYSLESLVAQPPDLVIYPDRSVGSARIASLLREDQRWAGIARTATFLAVDEDSFTRPGPRIVDAARKLNALLDAQKIRR